MDINWSERDTWIGVFDILGFKGQIKHADNEILRTILKDKLADLLRELESNITEHGQLHYIVFSDTIVIFAPDMNAKSYPWFLLKCQNLMDSSIYVKLPLRGAISTGTVFTSDNPPVIIGQPFVEAHEYCEDQNWIGLLLTPSATTALRKFGLEPLRHDFVSDNNIPLKEKSVENVLAYRFQNGSANFDSPLLPYLRERQHFAPDKEEKYDKTIAFIGKYYRRI